MRNQGVKRAQKQLQQNATIKRLNKGVFLVYVAGVLKQGWYDLHRDELLDDWQRALRKEPLEPTEASEQLCNRRPTCHA
jgi:hypothetical protein